ncbi:hypothetical protein BGW38_007417 [Lunasporangiospora selenospora]|uniref:Arsenate reductase n=1 Tax=Lunasporangiospora selenospora TaxID=979761 RepID=A0A9P6KII4_9FUNG|nr:hypothetical protein BGW38_007417 [Lunasporangiospora selenospora]
MSSAVRTITFFHNPRCSTSRNAAKLLETAAESGPKKGAFQIDTIEYLKEPLTKEQVKEILSFLDAERKPEVFSNFLRKDAPAAQSIEQVQEIIASDPAHMQRPLVVDWSAGKAVIGRPAEAVLDIINDL